MTLGTWDVAIVGGGPAGCATALALRQVGIDRTCIIDAAIHPPARVGETLPPDTRWILQRLQLWDDFVREGHEPCLGSCSTWGSSTPGHNDFLLNLCGSGWHLDRARFDALLSRRAAAAVQSWLPGTRLERCERSSAGGFRLRLRDARGSVDTRTARFVVDATGVRSAIAQRWLGARARRLDRLTFVYGFFAASAAASASRLTLLEAAEGGWWYAARVPDGLIAVAYASDAEEIRRRSMADEQRWFAALLRTHQIAPRLDGCRLVRGSLTARLAPSFLLQPAAGAGWLAVGDAASAHDPLSSQGIHKALSDGSDAAAAIATWLDESSARSDALASYAASIATRFEEYRVNRRYFYDLEQRWPDARFWRERRARSELAA